MQVTSNIKGVITRVTRLKDRDIPAALRAALQPAQWKQPAYETAEETLNALADQNQKPFVPQFLKTLLVDVFGTGFFLRLKSPFIGDLTIADYQAARGAVAPSDLGQNLFQRDWDTFKDLMAEWVATEKDKDKRDAGKSDADIGEWLAYEMLAPDGGHTVKHGPNKGRPVREVFLPLITDFLQRKQGMSRLEPAVVDAWLRAVLAAWRLMVHDLFPGKFQAALRSATSELALGGTR